MEKGKTFFLLFAFVCIGVSIGVANIVCTQRPTEFIFVLDASGSVEAENFNINLKNAVATVLKGIPLGPGKSRVAFVHYSDAPTIDLRLSDNTKDGQAAFEHVNGVLKKIPFIEGGTATGDALALVKEKLLPESRAGVSRVVMVFTDGNSNQGRPVEDISRDLQSDRLVQMFAIGIGSNINKAQLNSIATAPGNVFLVDNYKDLAQKAEKIAEQTCRKVETAPPPTPRPLPRQTPNKGDVKIQCAKEAKAELIFVLDTSASVKAEDFVLVKRISVEIASLMNIGSNNVRVAAVHYSSNVFLDFNLNQFKNRAEVVQALMKIQYTVGSTATGDALALVESKILSIARPGVKRILFTITDGSRNHGVVYEKVLPKLNTDPLLVRFAIGIGADINQAELQLLASNKNNIFMAKDFITLKSLVPRIGQVTCKELVVKNKTPSPTGRTTPKKKTTSPPSKALCPKNVKSELIFVLDTSGSIKTEDFTLVKRAVADIAASMTIGAGSFRVAAIHFGTNVFLDFNLNQFQNVKQVVEALMKITYTSGSTATGDALALVESKILPIARPGVRRILITATDGSRNHGVAYEKVLPKLNNDRLLTRFAIGIGIDLNRAELESLASNKNNVFMAKDYKALAGQVPTISKAVCKASQVKVPPPPTRATPKITPPTRATPKITAPRPTAPKQVVGPKTAPPPKPANCDGLIKKFKKKCEKALIEKRLNCDGRSKKEQRKCQKALKQLAKFGIR